MVYQELIDKFEEQNPDIKVKMQLTPWDQFWTKFDASAGTAEMPDTFFMNLYAHMYIDAGIMEPLNDWIERDGLDMSLYTDAIVDYYTTADGIIACMPKGLDSIAVACNNELFEKYGIDLPTNDWTWEDMVNICAEMKAAAEAAGDDIYPMSLALNSGNSSWQHIMTQFGGSMFDKGVCTFGSAENQEAFESICSLVDNGYIPDYSMICDTTSEDLFISGKVGMIYLPTFSSQKIEQSNMTDLTLVTLPEAKTKNAALGGMGYGMSASSEHKEEAWRFLKYLGSEEANDIIAKSGIDLPALISSQKYYPDMFTKFDGSAFVDQLNSAVACDIGPVLKLGETARVYMNYIMQMFNNEIEVADGLNEIQTQITEVLAEE